VINTKLNAFLIETPRTITDIDMMVLSNLVEKVICRYFCSKIFFTDVTSGVVCRVKVNFDLRLKGIQTVE